MIIPTDEDEKMSPNDLIKMSDDMMEAARIEAGPNPTCEQYALFGIVMLVRLQTQLLCTLIDKVGELDGSR